MSDVPVLSARRVTRRFDDGRVIALDSVDFDVELGEFVALTGPSGSGKSTLLNVLGALDIPDAGTISYLGTDLAALDRDAFRADRCGFVFQLHNLLPGLTAIENVEVPALEGRGGRRARRAAAQQLLDEVGLGSRPGALPNELSGGERQRVAIARALMNGPTILLADEPTGNLDQASGRRILDLIDRIRLERGLTVLLVTHDLSIASRADRVVRLVDGRITSDETGGHGESVRDEVEPPEVVVAARPAQAPPRPPLSPPAPLPLPPAASGAPTSTYVLLVALVVALGVMQWIQLRDLADDNEELRDGVRTLQAQAQSCAAAQQGVVQAQETIAELQSAVAAGEERIEELGMRDAQLASERDRIRRQLKTAEAALKQCRNRT